MRVDDIVEELEAYADRLAERIARAKELADNPTKFNRGEYLDTIADIDRVSRRIGDFATLWERQVDDESQR